MHRPTNHELSEFYSVSKNTLTNWKKTQAFHTPNQAFSNGRIRLFRAGKMYYSLLSKNTIENQEYSELELLIANIYRLGNSIKTGNTRAINEEVEALMKRADYLSSFVEESTHFPQRKEIEYIEDIVNYAIKKGFNKAHIEETSLNSGYYIVRYFKDTEKEDGECHKEDKKSILSEFDFKMLAKRFTDSYTPKFFRKSKRKTFGINAMLSYSNREISQIILHFNAI